MSTTGHAHESACGGSLNLASSSDGTLVGFLLEVRFLVIVMMMMMIVCFACLWKWDVVVFLPLSKRSVQPEEWAHNGHAHENFVRGQPVFGSLDNGASSWLISGRKRCTAASNSGNEELIVLSKEGPSGSFCHNSTPSPPPPSLPGVHLSNRLPDDDDDDVVPDDERPDAEDDDGDDDDPDDEDSHVPSTFRACPLARPRPQPSKSCRLAALRPATESNPPPPPTHKSHGIFSRHSNRDVAQRLFQQSQDNVCTVGFATLACSRACSAHKCINICAGRRSRAWNIL